MTTETCALDDLLGLKSSAVAVAFRREPPEGLSAVETPAPSGCTFWKRAADGQAFYTRAKDHYGCPIGSHTHGIDLPPAHAQELQGMVGQMVGLGYLDPKEVETLPRLEGSFGVALYAPLAAARFEPDVVLVRGSARQLMLLFEACAAAGAGAPISVMGRPTCALVPLTLKTGRPTLSLGCVGNRVYTQLGDDELYCAIPGAHIREVVARLVTILSANEALEQFHRGRQ